ncbi:MAG: glycine--tRNA ligase [Pyrodictiaceae archaeon]
MGTTDIYEKVMELAKRRGFLWQSYEIYGGLAGFYDIGPLGTLVKNKIIELWRRIFIKKHQEIIVEIETPIIGPRIVYEASGHLEHFTDPIVECKRCGRKFRADHLIEEALGINAESLTIEEMNKTIREKNIRCPVCGGELSEVKRFNLLFRTIIGPYSENVGFLRPENAQGIFVAFKRVHEVMRKKLPLGIAQIGRVARNEISPRQGIIRLREFTIAEFEFFYDPEEPDQGGYLSEYLARVSSKKLKILTYEAKLRGEKPVHYTIDELVREKIVASPWLAYWMSVAQEFVEKLGVPSDNIYFEEKGPSERAHYSSQTFDQMVKVSRWGWIEVSGHSYRTDYDLSRHSKYSQEDLTVFKQYEKPRVLHRKRIIVDMAWLGRTYKSKASVLLKQLNQMDASVVEDALRRQGYVEVAGEKIPADKIIVKEVEEKITGRRFLPHVVEPSFGVERLLYVSLEYAYREKEGRVVLSLPRYIAPYDAAVFPLVRDDRLIRIAKEIYNVLRDEGFLVIYDDDGSIGRRYARVDEIGVPIAVTVDYQSIEDKTVTLRDRDSWEQVRIPIDRIPEAIKLYIETNINIRDLREKLAKRL